MNPPSPPLAFFVLWVSGWVNREQEEVIDYLLEENCVSVQHMAPDGRA